MAGKRFFVDVLPAAYTFSLYTRPDEKNPQVIAAANWVKKLYGELMPA